MLPTAHLHRRLWACLSISSEATKAKHESTLSDMVVASKHSTRKQVHDITRSFQSQLSPSSSVDRTEDGETRLHYMLLADLYARFRLWSGTVGAHYHRKDPRSLRQRLRTAPEVEERVSDLLHELQIFLREGATAMICRSGSLPNVQL